YLPNLAASLWNVGFVALEVDSVTSEVIALTAEGVGYFETLAAAEPEAFAERHQAAVETLTRLQHALDANEPTNT
ncbi:hypothetical protein, partial [Actinoplanes derwentensis]